MINKTILAAKKRHINTNKNTQTKTTLRQHIKQTRAQTNTIMINSKQTSNQQKTTTTANNKHSKQQTTRINSKPIMTTKNKHTEQTKQANKNGTSSTNNVIRGKTNM